MATEIAVMLAVSDAQAAVEFYKRAFGAELYWTVGGDDHMVAGLAIGGARFFLATEVAGIWDARAVVGGNHNGED